MDKVLWTTDKLRTAFLEFFRDKGHKVVESDSLVPSGDPTVFFTSAGMNQFKPQFMGAITDFTRATSCQKCLRTDDLEEVGKTPYHHTFFEMLGNFSFGDYFKREAILWAWEFLTQVLGIPPDKLYVSVHKDDDEAFDIWVEEVGFPPEKIAKLGDKSNFWPSDAIKNGPNGPCGPCSEIFFDQGSVRDDRHSCGVDCDCGRFSEIWNLVFTQFNRKDGGKLDPLPQKNIDTGMGLERIAAVMQGKRSNFEIDIFVPIVDKILELVGKSKVDDLSSVYSIADHIRAVVFAIADGVMPSNEGRGYVIRKLIRKAVWHQYSLGGRKSLSLLVPVVVDVMRSAYPQLIDAKDIICGIVDDESERFMHTLERGLDRIEKMLNEVKSEGKKVLSGKSCFLLYDTYGFPLEMTKQVAARYGIEVDEDGFEEELEEQRRRSKSDTDGQVFAFEDIGKVKSKFIGYDKLEVETFVSGILKDGKFVLEAEEGEVVDIVLEENPFYGEAGGQVGDRGQILSNKCKIEVLDTKKVNDICVMKAKVLSGKVSPGDKVDAFVLKERRWDIARHHTATHLLQAALRKLFGEKIRQAGSLVDDMRLRFDFTFSRKLTCEEVKAIEDLVNTWIMENYKVEKMQMSLAEAKDRGALAFFGEKYGDRVRVVEIDNVSIELCGGTHVDFTGQIGSFYIVSERAIAGGVRRIEAVCGKRAVEFSRQLRDVVEDIKVKFSVDIFGIKDAIENIISEKKEDEKKIKEYEMRIARMSARQNVVELSKVGDIRVLSGWFDGADMSFLRVVWDQIKKNNKDVVALLGGVKENKGYALVCSNAGSVSNLCDVVSLFKKIINCGGGGRGGIIQIGIKDSVDKFRSVWKEIERRFVEFIGTRGC